MKKRPKKLRSARREALIFFIAVLILAPIAVLSFVWTVFYPLTPEMAMHDYELELLYGPSEVLAEISPTACPPGSSASAPDPDSKLLLAKSGNYRSLCMVERYLGISWSADRPWVAECPTQQPVALYSDSTRTGRLLGMVRDKDTASLTLSGDVALPGNPSPPVHATFEVPRLHDRAFALWLDGCFFTGTPITVTGYDSDGQLLFSETLLPTDVSSN